MRPFRAVAMVVAVAALWGCGPSEPQVRGAAPDMRLLSEAQYRNVIADVFGVRLEPGRFDPPLRANGLYATTARMARITPSAFERYYRVGRSVAEKVTSPAHRATLFPCEPAAATTPDDACAKAFFVQAGRLLYRRPLTDEELGFYVKAAGEGARTTGDFYKGAAMSLASLLVTPQFLYIADTTEADPSAPGAVRLNSYAKASRLSFLLWNSGPDEALLQAAAKDELQTSGGLTKQVDRMMASPRFNDGVRAFFTDFLDFQKFETLEKDPGVYPTFTLQIAEDSKEQILRTVADELVVRNSDYRTLFTTQRTFLTRALGRVYRVPVDRTDDGWEAYEFPADNPRAGIQTQIGLLALYSHPGRSSPTLRGRAVRELLLCQRVPDPPGDVDFSLFQDPNSPNKTARDRLTAHRTADTCAGCHKITDPIGLGFENFDGAGQFRTLENQTPIDPSGDLDGKAYANPRELGRALHDDPAAPACVINRYYSYAMGRSPDKDDNAYIAYLQETFRSDGYKFRALIRRVVLGDAFFAVTPPIKPAAKTASHLSAEEDNS